MQTDGFGSLQKQKQRHRIALGWFPKANKCRYRQAKASGIEAATPASTLIVPRCKCVHISSATPNLSSFLRSSLLVSRNFLTVRIAWCVNASAASIRSASMKSGVFKIISRNLSVSVVSSQTSIFASTFVLSDQRKSLIRTLLGRKRLSDGCCGHRLHFLFFILLLLWRFLSR